ncbi:MAG TPA: hypothetical protein VFX02_01900 [Gammaproteobacteria bacterium]|nr:hypothetical protein [Gammaproteobacteria bacterium]
MKRYIMAVALLLSGIPIAGAQDDGFMTIHEFKSKSGTLLGQLQVRYISREIFDSLKIVKAAAKQEEVLYRIDNAIFYSRGELEKEIYDPGFYGYKIAELAADHVTLTYMRNKGKSASDNFIIKWDSASQAFHRQSVH